MGRLWAVQFLQYPNPSWPHHGHRDKCAPFMTVCQRLLRIISKGEDKITIHEDTDGDGKRFTQSLCRWIRLVHLPLIGYVWVLNPPYLLFYPDKDQNDVPDGDPEVHSGRLWNRKIALHRQ
ncbi:MAG: hypothetical protein U0894_08570 [Pirellulales bacterium]